MAKKQTRRSISVSRTTYERLKAFCESNNISMSQLVETRVNDFLGPNDVAGMPPMVVAGFAAGGAASPLMMSSGANAGAAMASSAPMAPRAMVPRPVVPAVAAPATRPVEPRPVAAPPPAPAASPPPMTSAAARFAVDPPPPIIKPRQDTAAPKPAEKRPDQIFTF
ncbi:MAG TPA: hypothetical protein VHW23_28240 [Kofleriaceae bacterium]|jgi:hypothetical protein|nr:hypothetical protein [Kofleriaceae bacterium]